MTLVLSADMIGRICGHVTALRFNLNMNTTWKLAPYCCFTGACTLLLTNWQVLCRYAYELELTSLVLICLWTWTNKPRIVLLCESDKFLCQYAYEPDNCRADMPTTWTRLGRALLLRPPTLPLKLLLKPPKPISIMPICLWNYDLLIRLCADMPVSLNLLLALYYYSDPVDKLCADTPVEHDSVDKTLCWPAYRYLNDPVAALYCRPVL